MHRARLPIAQPCHERFDAMAGRGAERFCDKCSTPVHDLSQMTKVQAQLFLAERSGQRVCVRYRADVAGDLQFRPAPPVRPVLALAVVSLALAACTGWVEADSIESPEDAIACEDPSGYTIPCEDSVAPPPAEVITTPAPDHPGDVVSADPVDVEVDAAAEVEGQEMGQEMGQVELLGDVVVDPQLGAEGCPVPLPEVHEDDVLMGRIIAPPESRLKRHRLERQWKREQRRAARRDRRSGPA